MTTMANGEFSNPTADSASSGEVGPIDVPKEFPLSVQTLEIVREKAEGVSLESATVIVAGGSGVENHNGWQQIAELAGALNSGFVSTRLAVDAGWTELETIIGQSGKIVSPELYIGVGLSRKLKHMVGIVGAKAVTTTINDPMALFLNKWIKAWLKISESLCQP
jgi:electron transfer flavoprotein alpha subunit